MQRIYRRFNLVSSKTREIPNSGPKSFIEDADEYVRRRALLATQIYDPAYAEAVAIRWITTADDYSRLAALHILYEVESAQLDYAINQLRDDPFLYIRQKVAAIEGNV
jgi:hypothetical protein